MNKDTVNHNWMSTNEVELMPSQFHYVSKPQSNKGHVKKRNLFDRAVPFFGLILATLGAIGIVGAFSSPFSLPGGILYLLVGFIISLTYSVSLRSYFLRSIPSGVNELLFEKSLLDILTETSAAAKGYQLISMIPLLGADEVHILSETLPDECIFLRQKGLVHLLPVSLRDMLYGTQRSLLSLPSESENVPDERNNGSVSEEYFPSEFPSFFHLPSFLQEVLLGETLSSVPSVTSPIAPNSTPYSNMRSTPTTNNNDYAHGITPGSVPGTVYESVINSNIDRSRRIRSNIAHTAAQTLDLSIPQGDFERTLQDILNRKTKVTTDWVKDIVTKAVVSNTYYITSGGDLSDRFMVGLLAMGAVGAAVASTIQRRFPSSEGVINVIGDKIAGGISSNIMITKRIQHLLHNTVHTTVTYAVPCMTSLAIAAGGMLAIRKIHEHRPLHGCSSLVSSSVVLPIARNFLKKVQYSSIKIFTFGQFYNINDPMILIAVSAWTLTAFLAVKLRRNFKSLRWIFNVIVQKLLYDCECELSMNPETGVYA